MEDRKSLELFGYFEGSLSDDTVEELFFDKFLQENSLSFFGLDYFDNKEQRLDLNGELFDGTCKELELYAKFEDFCQNYGLRFVFLDK